MLSKALAETFKVQPNDPVSFFAKFLLNHSKTAKRAKQVSYVAVICMCYVGERPGEGGQGYERSAFVEVERAVGCGD